MLLGAGCSTLEPRVEANVQQQQAHAPTLAAFVLTARFHLQLEPQQEGEVRQYVGRLSWSHTAEQDRLLFMDPTGQGVAELQYAPGGSAWLQLADGSKQEADDPDELVAGLLGAPLPLQALPGWVQAQPGAGALLELDSNQRPAIVREAGWLLLYRYATDDSRLPARLDASLNGVAKLRLFVESWEALP